MFVCLKNALCVSLEHRYYGYSIPTPWVLFFIFSIYFFGFYSFAFKLHSLNLFELRDFSTQNLKYLTSEQALADLASFRRFIYLKYGLTENNRWVAFGGSYAGSLAAWLRLKYPHLIYAAVSSSAPVLAKLNFFEYHEVATKTLSRYSPQCTQDISMAIKAMDELVESSTGRSKLEKLFKLKL